MMQILLGLLWCHLARALMLVSTVSSEGRILCLIFDFQNFLILKVEREMCSESIINS
jgi:hypothetical protein